MAGKEVVLATALVGFIFYLMGRAYATYILSFLAGKSFAGRILLALLGVSGFAVLFFTSQMNQRILMYLNEYGNAILFLLNACLGTISTLLVSYAIRNNRLLEFYGKKSLLILITHFPVFHILTVAIRHFSHISNAWTTSASVFVLTCILELVFVNIINRHIPILAGKISL